MTLDVGHCHCLQWLFYSDGYVIPLDWRLDVDVLLLPLSLVNDRFDLHAVRFATPQLIWAYDATQLQFICRSQSLRWEARAAYQHFQPPAAARHLPSVGGAMRLGSPRCRCTVGRVAACTECAHAAAMPHATADAEAQYCSPATSQTTQCSACMHARSVPPDSQLAVSTMWQPMQPDERLTSHQQGHLAAELPHTTGPWHQPRARKHTTTATTTTTNKRHTHHHHKPCGRGVSWAQADGGCAPTRMGLPTASRVSPTPALSITATMRVFVCHLLPPSLPRPTPLLACVATSRC